jgi:hypothetical protein
MNAREEICAFAKLNKNGKCIAICHHNIDGTDCTGNDAPTFQPESDHPDYEKRKL